jgi:NADH dehydrogenase [ubiquinone] 1 alpha subcomplex assembly factor 7
MIRSFALAACLAPLAVLAQDDDRPEIVAPTSGESDAGAAQTGSRGHHLITKEMNKEAVKEEKVRQKEEAEAKAKADAEAKAKADAEAKIKAEADAKAKAEEDRKRLAEQEKRQKEEAARLSAEQKKIDAELKRQEALKAKEAELAQKRAELEARKKLLADEKAAAEERKKTADTKKQEEGDERGRRATEAAKRAKAERQAELDQKRLDAEAKRLEEEEARQTGRLAAEQKKIQDAAGPAPAKTRRVLQPGQAPAPQTTAAAANPAGASPAAASPAAASPAVASPTAASTDPRMRAGSLVEDAQLKVASIAASYAYADIPTNGCSQGTSFVMGQLVGPFDGMPPGTHVVLRIEDPSLGPVRAGGALAFSGLRRAGKAADGTYVYCGKGVAFPIHR